MHLRRSVVLLLSLALVASCTEGEIAQSDRERELIAIADACQSAREHVRDCFRTEEPEEIIAPCIEDPSLASAEEILAKTCDDMFTELGVTFSAHCDRDCNPYGSDCPSNMYCGWGTGCLTATGHVCWDKKGSGESCNKHNECASGWCNKECRGDLILGFICLHGFDRWCD